MVEEYSDEKLEEILDIAYKNQNFLSRLLQNSSIPIINYLPKSEMKIDYNFLLKLC